jgi:Tfp pilus assembly protein PilN
MLRFCVTATVLVIVLVSIAAILLIPTYLFLAQDLHVQNARLALLESNLVSQNQATLPTYLSVLSTDTVTLTALGAAPSSTDTIRTVLAVPHPGITLSQFSYAPSVQKSMGTLQVSGIAATRDALQQYQLALEAAFPGSQVTLPVSTYAQAAKITFTVTVQLTS